jgi:hypothetical protein
MAAGPLIRRASSATAGNRSYDRSVTTVTESALDAAFDKLAAAGFELPNGFVNHGAMACEALDALGIDADLERWAGRFSHVRGGVEVVPVVDPSAFDARDHLGHYARLPEWIGFFASCIRVDGWEAVVAEWVPVLTAAFATKLFHGAIRAGHATRAVSKSDTAARRAELARAFGYWAARYSPARAASADVAGEPKAALLDTAALAARRYVEGPDIFTLHGVTGAMAAELLLPHISEQAGLEMVARVRADHDRFYGPGPSPPPPAATELDWAATGASASASHDPHQVKLVEACRRGAAATGDPAFTVAAGIVTS